MARKTRPYECSFCGKDREQTRRVIAGPNGVYICAECVALCNEILSEGHTIAPGMPDASPQATSRRDRRRWRLLDWWHYSRLAPAGQS